VQNLAMISLPAREIVLPETMFNSAPPAENEHDSIFIKFGVTVYIPMAGQAPGT
jgi:hypothetical protein